MLTEIRSQTLIAALIILGCFGVIIVYAIRGDTVPPGIMTLVTALTTGVVGFYFGTRGAVSAADSAHQTITSTAQAVTQVVDATVTPSAAQPAGGPYPQR